MYFTGICTMNFRKICFIFSFLWMNQVNKKYLVSEGFNFKVGCGIVSHVNHF